jgi:hypothetical protein
MSTIHRVELDSTLRCPDAVDFERRLRERIVGQDEAIERVTWMVQTFMAGFNPPGCPGRNPAVSGTDWDSALTTFIRHSPRLPPASPPPLHSTAIRIQRIRAKWLKKKGVAVMQAVPKSI